MRRKNVIFSLLFTFMIIFSLIFQNEVSFAQLNNENLINEVFEDETKIKHEGSNVENKKLDGDIIFDSAVVHNRNIEINDGETNIESDFSSVISSKSATVFEVSNLEEWNTAVNIINGEDGNYTIKLMADIDIENSSTVVFKGGTTRILGNGHKITHIYTLVVEEKATLKLGADDGTDVLLVDGERTEKQKVAISRTMIHVDGVLEMHDGVTIANRNEIGSNCPGFLIKINTGTFTMYGGEIKDNFFERADGGTGGLTGVVTIFEYVGGKAGTFRMLGGVIKDNEINALENEAGNLRGAAITSYNGNVEITGGTIEGNVAKGKYIYGGAINFTQVDPSNTLIIENASIINNEVIGSEVAYGGGIFVLKTKPEHTNPLPPPPTPIKVLDSTIANNSGELGGGIFASNVNIEITGDSVIANNKATVAGADIFLEDLSNIILPNAKNMVQRFEGNSENKNITGWYSDNDEKRWGLDNNELIPNTGTDFITVPSQPFGLIAAYNIQPLPEVGGISITKTVSGAAGDSNKNFNFKLTVNHREVIIDGNISGAEFSNGVHLISLKHGQTKTINDLPKGATYIVEEVNTDGYTVKTKNATGIIEENQIALVEFNNHKDNVIPIKISPTVKKVVEGNPERPGTFAFVLKADNTTYPMPIDSTVDIKEITVKGAGEYEFGEINFDKVGIYTYKITEKMVSEDGYTYDNAEYKLTYVVTENNGKLEVISTIEKDEKVVEEIILTNLYKKTEINHIIDMIIRPGAEEKPNIEEKPEIEPNLDIEQKIDGDLIPSIEKVNEQQEVERLDSEKESAQVMFDGVPKTGDTTNVAFLLILIGLSLMGLFLSWRKHYCS